MFNLLLTFCLFEKDIYIDTLSVQIAEASKMYMELDKDKKSFTLIPCWNILKEEDKWKDKMIELAELEKQADKKKTSSPRCPGQGMKPPIMKLSQMLLLSQPKKGKGHRG